MKYEVHDKSRFAGEGHEYHCLDYSESIPYGIEDLLMSRQYGKPFFAQEIPLLTTLTFTSMQVGAIGRAASQVRTQYISVGIGM